MALALHYDFVNNPSLTDQEVGPDITCTRASNATMVDADGYIREVYTNEPRFSGATWANNLVRDSDDLTIWSGPVDATITSGFADPDGGANAFSLKATAQAGIQTPFIRNNWDIKAGGAYFLSVTMKRAATSASTVRGFLGWVFATTTGTLTYPFGSGSVTDGPVPFSSTGVDDLGDGWYRVWGFLEPQAGDADLNGYFYLGLSEDANSTLNRIEDPDGTEEVYFYQPMMEDVTGKVSPSRSAYIETTSSTPVSVLSGTSDGLLVEAARTNLCLYSADTSNAAWVASNVTKGSTSVTTPDGTASTTVRLTSTAGNGTLLQTITSASATRAYSVYMKRVTGTGNIDLTVDGGATWTTKTLTAEWTRFDITQATVTDPVFGVRIVTSGDAIDFWGSQLETGDFPTSYIPTTSATVTRAAEVVTASSISANADVTRGTHYMSGTSAPGRGGTQYFWRLDDGTTNEVIQQFWNSSNGVIRATSATNATNEIALNTGAVLDAASAFRMVLGWAVDDVQGYLDGASTGTDTSYDPTTTELTRIYVGQNNAGNQFGGTISEIAYFDERLDDTTLEGLSDGSITVASFGNSFETPIDPLYAMPWDSVIFHDFIAGAGGVVTGDLARDYREALAIAAGLTAADALGKSLNDAWKKYYESL